MLIKKIYVKGMHCVSCEKLLDDELKNIKGVETVKADRRTNIVEIGYSNQEPSFIDFKKTAEKFGYEVSENNPEEEKNSAPKKGSWASWINAILVTLVLLFLFRIFQNTGIINKIDFGGSEITFGIAFLIGLAASISSCLAVVGAVVIAFGEKYKSEGNNFYENAVRPNLFFHIGRLSTFFILGGMLGMIGGEINISGNFISIFTVIVAIVMAWLGLNILGILPSISNLISMPRGLTKNWNNLKKSEHKMAPFLLGGLSFFLPCGFTQSMQIFALTSGSFLVGGLSLFIFALGTVPALMVLGVAVSWTKNNKMLVFQKVAGFLVVFFAIYTLQSGLALKGVKTDVLSTSDKKQLIIDDQKQTTGNVKPTTNDTKQEQIVETKLTYNGFEPAVLKIKKGIPVKFVIDGEQVSGCTNRIIIPDYDISKSISYGENIIKFTPTKAGTVDFSCWMGMVRGKFIVE